MAIAFGVEFILFVIAVALVFDFFNGINDAANSIATVVATKVLKPAWAVLLAATFNFLGPFMGTAVAATVGKGIVDPEIISPELVLAGLLGGIAWTSLATHYGLPISVSHSLIGGLMGAAIAANGVSGLQLPDRQAIMTALVPMRDGAIVGFVVAAGLWLAAGRFRSALPAALGGAFLGSGLWLSIKIFAGTVAVKGLLATILFIFYSPMLGFIGGYILSLAVVWAFRRTSPLGMKRLFGILQIGSASFYSFGHGRNDGQKTMGVIMALLIAAGWVSAKGFHIPIWVILISAGAIALGTLIGGYKVVHTMGMKLTRLQPYQGFSAESSSAVGLHFLADAGVPVSTTHSITGSILGVGALRGGHNVNWDVARTIVGAWILTIPASAVVAFLFNLTFGWFISRFY